MGLSGDRRISILVLTVLGIILIGVIVVGVVDRHPDRARVTVIDEDGARLGTVTVRVADTVSERYTGLSETDSLDSNEGMLFVHEDEGSRSYVMRDMAFPIDIVFIGSNGRITAIYRAEPEEPPFERYTGQAKWVLEVTYNWTTVHDVGVGDRVEIDY